MNPKAAIAFVRRQGDFIEQARLNYLLEGRRPPQAVINALLTGQRQDGGWLPLWATDYSSLDATCFRLAQAEQLGISASEAAIAKAVEFLARRQRDNGSWQEDETMALVAPSWARPGETSARLYLTANCGFWLATLVEIQEETLRAAGSLLTHLDRQGHLPSFLHTHWLAGGLWFCLDWGGPVERVLGYLAGRLQDFHTSNLSWMLLTLLKTGFPTNHPLIDRAARLLVELQYEDGRWTSEDGPDYDVHATLEALRALQLCGLL